MSVIGVGVIGYGYWGPNLARNLAELEDATLVSIADAKADRRAFAGRRHPGVTLVQTADELIADPRVDAVVIATPVATHYKLAHSALAHGKHVFVEKPICSSSTEALELVEFAKARHRVLLVDHTFVYTGAVRKIRELVRSEHLGDLYYYDSVRVNLGLFQHDVSVLWDLAVHDLSIMDYALGARPIAVSCTGINHIPGTPEDVAYLTLFFEDAFVAHLHVNWLSPVKLRRTLIGGSKKMIVYDDLEPVEKIKVHDKGLIVEADPEKIRQLLLRGYRSGDVWSPQIEPGEALSAELKHFVQCIQRSTEPITDGMAGYRVVSILEAAELSLRRKGAPVELAGALQEA